MSKSDYLESKVLRHIIGAAAYTAPASIYLGLLSSDPGETGGGTELSGGSPAYARKPITWGTESGGTVANSVAVSVNVPTGTATHWGLFDAVSGGNLLYSDSFESPIATASGTPLVFAIGDITITEK